MNARPVLLSWLVFGAALGLSFSVGAFFVWSERQDVRALTRILNRSRCVYYDVTGDSTPRDTIRKPYVRKGTP